MERDLAIPPGRQGYRMPAEWEPHVATWLCWPHKEASWPGRLERIPPIFEAMVEALAPGEIVRVLVRDAEMRREVGARLRRVLGAGGFERRVVLHEIAKHHVRLDRDHGPIFLNRSAVAGAGGPGQAIVDWGYNAWGGKYPPFELDDAVPRRIGAELGLPVFEPGMILEGGSIDVNGAGALLTSESCLLNPNRNPEMSRGEIERRLRDFLGVEQILWLFEGIAGDDTDGHVDDLARFVSADLVAAAVQPDRSGADYAPLRENLERLRAMRLSDGRRLRVVELPVPDPVEVEGQPLPASYANFYIGNQVVLMPAFACGQDERARRVLEQLFPSRRIVAMDCRDLVWGLGAFHCLTQQQPSAPGGR